MAGELDAEDFVVTSKLKIIIQSRIKLIKTNVNCGWRSSDNYFNLAIPTSLSPEEELEGIKLVQLERQCPSSSSSFCVCLLNPLPRITGFCFMLCMASDFHIPLSSVISGTLSTDSHFTFRLTELPWKVLVWKFFENAWNLSFFFSHPFCSTHFFAMAQFVSSGFCMAFAVLNELTRD